MLEKLFSKLDSSPRYQKIIEITPRQEKIAKRLSIPTHVAVITLIFWMAPTEAAEPDLTKFFTVHEVKPILEKKRDANGQRVGVVNHVEILLQLPGERVARRVQAPLQDTLFLDPRAPTPGARRYEAIIGLDGELEASK